MSGTMPGGLIGAGPQNTGWRPVRLILALIGAVAVSVGLYICGIAAIDALLVPAGHAFRLCTASCGDRIGNVTTGLGVGVGAVIVGGILKGIGRPRYTSY